MSNTDCPSLLPPNATQFERDLERVQCRAFDVPTPHRDLFDPWKCPEQFLPFLAWAESVDVWNDRWPSQTKRAVIANSRQLHEIKGTDGAIEQALAALGVRVEMKMWHEETPPAKRGTMKLLLWVNDNINPDADVMIDSEMIRDFVKTVDRTKRNCVHYTLTLATEMTTGFRVGHSVETATLQRMDADATEIHITPQTTGYRVGHSIETATLQRIAAQPNPIRITPQKTGHRVGFSGEVATLTYLDMTL